MIYITTGTYYLGFDRLIKSLDNNKQIKNFKFLAQIGGGKYKPKNFKYFDYCKPAEHIKNIKKSKLIITHGGIGSIMYLINLNKKFLVIPKNIDEHPNDQISAMKSFKKIYNINILNDLNNIDVHIKKILKVKKKTRVKLQKSNIPNLIKKYIQKIDTNE